MTAAIKIIDTDTHLSEPHDLWLRHAPAALRERVPQIKEYQGRLSWVIDGDKPIGFGGSLSSAVRKDGTKALDVEDFARLTFDDVHPGAYELKPRLAEMDKAGIYAQIVYPNILGFGGQACAKVDPSLRLASVQIYNDAVAEMQADSGERFFPMALLPWWDVKDAVKETERAKTLGLRGININSDPHVHKDENDRAIPDLASEHWAPLWEACDALNMPINFHIGASEQSMDWVGSLGWPSMHISRRGALSGSLLHLNNGRVMANIIYSGLLDRFPGIKFVSVESGIGWIPFLLESLDHQMAEMACHHRLEMKPSEYFRRNFYACFWFEKTDICHAIRQAGIDNVMFETDFPHPSCLFPLDDVDSRLGELTPDERLKVLSTNAAKLYNISIA